MAASGPLTVAELAELESTLLPALERHHLRLLAHGLRTLQAIAGRRLGPVPGPHAIAEWVRRQPGLAGDPGFQQAFTDQLASTGQQLESLARDLGIDPLALELGDLCGWAVQQANRRLQR